MIICYRMTSKQSFFVLLALFLPIWNSLLFVCQFYMKLCFGIKIEHYNVLSLYFCNIIGTNDIKKQLAVTIRTNHYIFHLSGRIPSTLKLTLGLLVYLCINSILYQKSTQQNTVHSYFFTVKHYQILLKNDYLLPSKQ